MLQGATWEIGDPRACPEACAKLVDHYLREVIADHGQGLADMIGPLKQAVLAGRLDGVLASRAGEPEGVALFTVADGGSGRLQWLHVLPRARGRGLQALLVAECTARMLAAGAAHLVCESLVEGDPEETGAAFASSGYDLIPRLTMTLELDEAGPGLLSPRVPDGYSLQPWQDEHLVPAAALVFAANAGTDDGRAMHEFATVASTEGALRQVLAGAAGTLDRQASHVVTCGNELCGVLLFTRRGEGEGFIVEVATSPDHRGRGLGRALVEAALRSVTGVWLVRLGVTKTNAPAMAMYTRLGFRPEAAVNTYVREVARDESG